MSPPARPSGDEPRAGDTRPGDTRPDDIRVLDRRTFLSLAARRAVTALAAFGLGLLIDDGWARAVRGPRLEREDYPRLLLGRYRIHHNIVGWILLAVGAFTLPWVLVPLGLGMIVGHRRRDRLFWFLERVG